MKFTKKHDSSETKRGGLRTKRRFNRNSHGTPLVSIITVVYNGANELESTIKSAITQSYNNIEYIIIDGGSTDATLDIIRKYDEWIDYWVSERDDGIYDAMNKGVDLATGDWIIFLNCGDKLYETKTVAEIFDRKKYDSVDVIYGNIVVVYDDGYSYLKKPGELKNLWKKMVIFHPSIFMKTSLMKKYHFNKNLYASDFGVILNLYMKGYVFHNSNVIVSKFAAGGVSDLQKVRFTFSRFLISVKYVNKIKCITYYILVIINCITKVLLKKYLPENIQKMIIRFRHNS